MINKDINTLLTFCELKITQYMDKFVNQLGKIGLSDKESLIYEYLLKNGGDYPSQIAKTTRLNRTTVYKILIKLSIQGLVAEVRKGKKLFYTTTSPQKLVRHAQSRVRQAEDALDYTKKIIPELEQIYSFSENKPHVKYYEGYDAVVESYFTHVENTQPYEMRAFASVNDLEAFFTPKLYKQYIKEKGKNRITLRVIVPDTEYSRNTYVKELSGGINKKYWPNVRYLPKDIFPFPAEITLFDKNKVSIVKFSDTHPISIVIEDKIIHDMMGMIFELSWNASKLEK